MIANRSQSLKLKKSFTRQVAKIGRRKLELEPSDHGSFVTPETTSFLSIFKYLSELPKWLPRLFEPALCDITRTFGIQHYTGRVVYDTTHFLGRFRANF